MSENKRIAKILSTSRYQAGISQEQMAISIGVSKQSVINWEKGTSCPKFKQIMQWFDILGVNMHRPLMEMIYPELFEDNNVNNEKEISSVIQFIKTLPPHEQSCLSYMLLGQHGSDPISLLQLYTAYLHLPIQYRVSLSRLLYETFEMCKTLNELVCMDNVMPNIELLDKSILLCKDAVYNGKNGYSN